MSYKVSKRNPFEFEMLEMSEEDRIYSSQEEVGYWNNLLSKNKNFSKQKRSSKHGLYRRAKSEEGN